MRGRKKRRQIRPGRRRPGSGQWAGFYREYYPRIRARLAARGVSEHDVDDLAEEVLAKLGRRGGADDLRAYIATAVANALAGYGRRRARERELLQSLLEEAAKEDQMRRYKAQECFEDAESGGERDRVEKMLSTLPRKEARLLKLRFLEGLRMAEVARRLGCSREAAYKRLQRTIKHLRALRRRAESARKTAGMKETVAECKPFSQKVLCT